MAASCAAGWSVGDLSICWGGGFDWELPGELLWDAGDCCVSGEGGGAVCVAVLGWRDGGAVYRVVAVDEVSHEHGAGDRGGGGGFAGDYVDPDAWAYGDVGDSCSGAVQFGDVPEHLYGGANGAWAPDFKGVEFDGGGDCGRRAD